MAIDRDILPKSVKPINYEIFLHDLELGGDFTFQGTVKIEVNIEEASENIILNAHQLSIHSAEISAHNKSLKAKEIFLDEKTQRVMLNFVKKVPVSKCALLQIDYAGVMNNAMAGFYRSKYKPLVTPAASVPKIDDFHYMFSTQFESSDARKALPCFDEPNLKATFDLRIEIPDDQVALSNMPEIGTQPGMRERKIVSFARTPVMSTYLLAWAFGDFEYVEDFTKRRYGGKQLPVRVYTTRGLKEQARFGLQNAHQIVDFFSEIFGIDYPLPKVDLLAVHEFSHGAMENWGLITYRTTAILFDEVNSDAKYKNRVAYVVAHELAHQWFGNLVTMDWWSELWLNEGFATWVGWLAIDHFYPDHLVWSQFVSEAVQTAFQLDALRASHPVEVPVKSALEIEQIFDAISYLKGSSVIRMLSSHLGEAVFLSGVSNYLKKHSYGNATTNDLWRALSKTSGKDVTTFMDPWIRKVGFPVLTLAEEPGQVSLGQSRFLSTGDVKPDDDETLWWVPLGIMTDPPATKANIEALTVKKETVRDLNENFYKFNFGQTGFFRTNYPPQRLAKLGKSKEKLGVEDRIGLIGDTAALAIAGNATTSALLTLVENFHDEPSHAVWTQIVTSLANIQSIFAENKDISGGLQKFILKLVTEATDKIGWDFRPNEDFLSGQLRALLITTAGGAGHQKTIQEAKRQFQAYVSGDRQAIHPSLRLPVFRINVTEGGKEEYDAVKQEYLNTSSIDGKEICLQSLGKVQTPELVKDFLEFQFSNQVAVQDIHSGSIALAANPKVRDAFWNWIKENWKVVYKKLSGNMVVFDRYLKNSLQKFASHEKEEDITEFFRRKDNTGYDRGLVQVSDTIRGNANYKERDEELVLEWLKAYKYA